MLLNRLPKLLLTLVALSVTALGGQACTDSEECFFALGLEVNLDDPESVEDVANSFCRGRGYDKHGSIIAEADVMDGVCCVNERFF